MDTPTEGLEKIISVSRSETADGSVVRVSGEIDVHSVAMLDRAVRTCFDEQHHDVVIDASGVTFIDSSGLRCLVALRRDAKEAGGAVEVRNPSPPVLRLLELTGLMELVER
jgi:anti-anti-sigma factor